MTSGDESALTLLGRIRSRLIGALAVYLAEPVKPHAAAAAADPLSLSAVLLPGDVLLTDGNTRAAALVRRITRSSWSHVSMYVGPLEEGPDGRCIVEADVAAGVRSVRLSELKGQHVRVLRPTGLNDMDRRRLVDWVISRLVTPMTWPTPGCSARTCCSCRWVHVCRRQVRWQKALRDSSARACWRRPSCWSDIRSCPP
jgi:hypothetical protein